MHIIERTSIPSISSIEIDGVRHNLGLLCDFRKHPKLKDLLPECARLSISWVRLKSEERLEPHRHPESSMIILTEGNGMTLGEISQSIKTGDVIFVPPDCLHGFMGTGSNGFWGLSIQFNGLGLYENTKASRVIFESDAMTKHLNQMQELMRVQEANVQEYSNNPLVKLVESQIVHEPHVKSKLLACLQFWSNVFQKVLFLKAALGSYDSVFQELSEDHIAEELGHNKILHDLSVGQQIWHPALASASSWFMEQMLVMTEPEKIILVNFVLEGSGKVFHAKAKNIFPDSKHFHMHDQCDEEHFMMGYQLLESQHGLDFSKLNKALENGWKMMNYLCKVIAEIALEK